MLKRLLNKEDKFNLNTFLYISESISDDFINLNSLGGNQSNNNSKRKKIRNKIEKIRIPEEKLSNYINTTKLLLQCRKDVCGEDVSNNEDVSKSNNPVVVNIGEKNLKNIFEQNPNINVSYLCTLLNLNENSIVLVLLFCTMRNLEFIEDFVCSKIDDFLKNKNVFKHNVNREKYSIDANNIYIDIDDIKIKITINFLLYHEGILIGEFKCDISFYLSHIHMQDMFVCIQYRDILNRIYYIENGVDHIIPSVIPIIKKKSSNNKSSLEQDFLLLSYNEGNTTFEQKDCYPIIFKVIKESPSFIVVCTQESSSSIVSHYQHVLKDTLENLNYELLFKKDGTIIGSSGKNVRTRIYCNKYKVFTRLEQNTKLEPNTKIEPNFRSNRFKSSGLKYKIILESHNLKGYSLTSGKFYKGVILLNFIIIDQNNNAHKFIIINTHLYYNKKGNTGLSERKKDFMDIITTYNLVEKYNSGYNIFLCGDLNFRLFHFQNTNTKTNFQNISEQIIFNYLTNQSNFKKNFTTTHKNTNELYQLLNNSSKNNKYNPLLNQFLKNYILIGLHLTAKYIEDKGKINENFYKRYNGIQQQTPNLKQNISKVFNIFPEKNIVKSPLMKLFITKSTKSTKTKYPPYPRIPSSTDKILFALNSINIENANYFDVFIYPNRSDHKMITLSFKI